MLLTEDQQELQTLVGDFFKGEYGSTYTRMWYQDGNSIPSATSCEQKIKPLGIFDAVNEIPGWASVETGIVARELGRALVPHGIVESLIFGCILPRIESKLTFSNPYYVVGTFAPRLTTLMVPRELLWKGTLVVVSTEEGSIELRECAATELIALDKTRSLYKIFETQETQETQERINVDRDELHKIERFYLLAKSMEALGAAEQAFDLTQKYLLERQQFGQYIGTFQAVQHKLADMYRSIELMRAITQFASWAIDHSPQQEVLSTLSAIQTVHKHVVKVVEEAIQLHGGIGFTWEHDLHLYLRRVKLIEQILRPTITDSTLLVAAA